jgi:hypothetical protein
MAPTLASLRLFASVLLAGSIWFSTGCAKREETPAPKATTATVATPTTAPEQVKRIAGRWLREDGGYVLEIKSGATGGVLEALYFNPQQNRTIHVSRAAWYEGAGKLQVLVELNDTGYPGATYILSHDAKEDQLVGEYRQPAMQQSFEVEFVREKKL